MFQVTHADGLARLGRLTTKHGTLDTPAVFPVHNLGADGGYNTPRYWEKYPRMNTAMFNAALLSMNRGGQLGRILEIGIHRFLKFFGVVFVDSGGFVYRKYRLRIKPERIVEIQEKVGADIASTLDFPISYEVLSENNLILLTIESAKNAASIKKNSDMLLFASINGYDPSIIKNAIKHLKRKRQFDGFALGSLMPRYSNYKILVNSILAARTEVKNKPLHVYGLGSPLITNLLMYLGVDSFDSSFFIISSGKRNYSVPGYGRVAFAALEKYPTLPCDCTICKTHSVKQLRNSRNLLTLHNLYVLGHEMDKMKRAIKEQEAEKHLAARFQRNKWAIKAFHYAKRKLRFTGG